jgi:hypothetical protein
MNYMKNTAQESGINPELSKQHRSCYLLIGFAYLKDTFHRQHSGQVAIYCQEKHEELRGWVQNFPA